MSVRKILQSTGRSSIGLVTALGLSLFAFQAQAATTLPTSAVNGVTAMEDIAEAVADGEVKPPKSLPQVKKLGKDWPGLRAELRKHSAPEEDLSKLDKAVAALETAADAGTDLRRPANEVTGALAPLFALTGDAEPPDVHTLDYANRSLSMDAKEGSWTRADADNTLLVKTWERLRPRIVSAKDGQPVAAEYDTCVKGVGKAVAAKDATALDSAAQHCNDIGDRVSKVF
jgi:hypothetical protein